MKIHALLSLLALTLLTSGCASSHETAQDEYQPKAIAKPKAQSATTTATVQVQAQGEPQAQSAATDMEAFMEVWKKAGAPGAPHAEFAKQVGTWDLTFKMWHDPSAAPDVHRGTSLCELALDGRFLVEKVSGDMGPPIGPFEGLGLLGYNNLTKQYDHIWMDSMGTGMMVSHGTADADGTVSMTGEYDDAMTGGKSKVRTVTKHISENEQRFEMYEDKGQGEMKTMEITYIRGKGR
jgi:hypothetical protein